MIVSLIGAISADGFIAASEAQNSLTWTSKEDTRFFVEKTKEIGTLVMGRKTFDTIGKPLKGRRVIVMSRTPLSRIEGEYGGVVEYTSESPKELVARLETEGVAKLVVCGGAMIYAQFLQAGLVHELFLTIEPVIFGEGTLLAPGCGRVNMTLVDSQPLGPGMLLHFRTNSKGL